MILSQTDLILRAIQVTSLRATALGGDTPGASSELFAPLGKGGKHELSGAVQDPGDRAKEP